MKKTIFLFSFLSLAIASLAQDIDTAYTSLRWGYNPAVGDSVWFETLTEVYTDGRTNVVETLAGDTTTVINYLFNRATDAGRRFDRSANEVWQKGQVVDFILQANQVLTTVLDTSIIQISVDIFGPAVDNTTWDIISTQGNFTGTLTIAPSGNNLRMQIGGQTYTLLPVGDAWIRFLGFPSGSYTDLHRKEGLGKLEYRSVDEKIIVRKR